MLTGEIKNQIDRIWDAFWSGGISNPLEVIEQITYLLFLRRLDDLQTLEENWRHGRIYADGVCSPECSRSSNLNKKTSRPTFSDN